MRRQMCLVLAALLAVAVLHLTGCVKIDAQFVAQPDLSVAGKLLLGMDAQLMQSMGQGGETPLDELKSGPMGELWTVREFEEGGWQYAEATGKVPAGAALFGEDQGAPQARVRKVEHRLSTRYNVRMSLPQMPEGGLTVPPEMLEGIEAGENGMPDVQGLMQVMLSGLQLRFALGGPGRVVSTNGTVVGAGLAEWRPTMEALTSGSFSELEITTELTNWTHLGRLADQITGLAGDDSVGMRLAGAVNRGLLPNPPVSVIGVDKLGAQDYDRLLAIVARLDEVLGPTETAEVMNKLGLNADAATSAEIAAAYDRAQASDFVSQVRAAPVQQALERLRS